MSKEANIINVKDHELDALRRGDIVVLRTDETIQILVSTDDMAALTDHVEREQDAELVREVVNSREVA